MKLTYNEIVDAISKINENELDNTSIKNRENRLILISIAEQLGYTVPNCGCKDKFKDLLIKICIWIKQHPKGFPHYAMKAGVVRKGKRGTNIYNLNLTDEEAEWLLENDLEAKTYLTKIIGGNVNVNDGTEGSVNVNDGTEGSVNVNDGTEGSVIVQITDAAHSNEPSIAESDKQEPGMATSEPTKKPTKKRTSKVK